MIYPVDTAIHPSNNWGQLYKFEICNGEQLNLQIQVTMEKIHKFRLKVPPLSQKTSTKNVYNISFLSFFFVQ